MREDSARAAAEAIWSSWERGQRLEQLPEGCRPRSLEEGYAIQAMLEEVSGCAAAGWKIAATNVTGQRHIGVHEPICGRILANRIVEDNTCVPIAHNHMRVAEAEFAFVLGRDLPPRERDYTPDEVLACAASLHPAIELPDSRFRDFATVGGAHLVAENACSDWFMLGEPAGDAWRGMDLAAHPVTLVINGRNVTSGHGADVLGGPLVALAWIANSHRLRGCGLEAGKIVTTGVCGVPSPTAPGDHVSADFGTLGRVELTFEN